MTDIRAALNLTACDVCMSVFYGSAWCHEVRTSPINWPALAAASPEPVLCEHYEPGDCPICDQPAPAARADERTRLGDHP